MLWGIRRSFTNWKNIFRRPFGRGSIYRLERLRSVARLGKNRENRKINDETAIQSLFYYRKNTREFIRKEMVLAVDKMLRGTPNEHDFAINAAKYYVQRYSHDFDNPKEIIDFLFNSSRGYYIEDPDGYSNIRADKSTSSKILGKVKSGEKIDVLDDTSNWYLIKTKEGLKGYVHKSRIKIK